MKTMLVLAAAVMSLAPMTASAGVRVGVAFGGPVYYGPGFYSPFWAGYWGPGPYYAYPFVRISETRYQSEGRSGVHQRRLCGAPIQRIQQDYAPPARQLQHRNPRRRHCAFKQQVYVASGKTIHSGNPNYNRQNPLCSNSAIQRSLTWVRALGPGNWAEGDHGKRPINVCPQSSWAFAGGCFADWRRMGAEPFRAGEETVGCSLTQDHRQCPQQVLMPVGFLPIHNSQIVLCG